MGFRSPDLYPVDPLHGPGMDHRRGRSRPHVGVDRSGPRRRDLAPRIHLGESPHQTASQRFAEDVAFHCRLEATTTRPGVRCTFSVRHLRRGHDLEDEGPRRQERAVVDGHLRRLLIGSDDLLAGENVRSSTSRSRGSLGGGRSAQHRATDGGGVSNKDLGNGRFVCSAGNCRDSEDLAGRAGPSATLGAPH